MHADRKPSGQDESARDPVAPTPTESYGGPSESLGSRIGPYKLLQQIGEGGMGVVYMAEQEQPVKRRVALKIIKPGMDTAQVVARFEAERQTLALMDHQNIAKVYDAGATETGRPYFVMELIHGVPITKYCDDNHLTVRERLELFVPVCKAIQHAHQKGIIHRDLKPSNVLVCLYDGQPVPKVIDFGVAKAADQRLTDRTMFTQYGQIVGTFEYMSPEQAEMSQLGVDTRSDIYSLGVMLYELLTGSTPLSRKRMREAGLTELVKMVKEDEPPKPSTRISSTEEVAKIAAARRSEPVKLARLLRGELDWVVMKCLEKDRARRYETANGLARDLEHYLHEEPVEAGPPGAGYRLRKLVRKHRTACTAAAAFVLVFLLAGALCVWQAVRATRAEQAALAERDRAEQEKERAQISFKMARDTVDRFFTKVGDSPQLKSTGMEKFRKDLLQNAKDFYERFVREQGDAPEARHELGLAQIRLAKIEMALVDTRAAEAALEKGVALLEELLRASPDVADYQRDLAAGYAELGNVYRGTGRLDKADAAYGQARDMQQKLVEAFPNVAEHRLALAKTHYDWARVHSTRDRWEKATASYEQAQAIQGRLVEEQPQAAEYRSALANTQTLLSHTYRNQGKRPQAEAVLTEAQRNSERLVREHPDVSDYQQSLARVHWGFGTLDYEAKRYEAAKAQYQKALQFCEKLAREHPDAPNYLAWVGEIYSVLGSTARMQSKLDEALALYDKAIALFEALLEKEPRSVYGRGMLHTCRLKRAMLLAQRGEHARAVQEAEALAANRELSGSNRYNLACVYTRAVVAAGKDDKLPPAERKQLSERYAALAVDALRQSVAKGWRNLTLFQKDPDLDPVRGRADFKKIVQELEELTKKP